MPDIPVSLLLIDHSGGRLAELLESEAAARGYRLTSTRSLEEALAATRRTTFQAALIDLEADSDSGIDAAHHLKEHGPDTEIIVISATGSLASAIKSYERAAFAFVPRPFELRHLLATIERALEHRRMTLVDRRLFWELQTINEISEEISKSLDLHTVLTGALQRIVRAYKGVGGSIRLRNERTGVYELRASVGPAHIRQLWAAPDPHVIRPSDQVISTRTAVIVEDMHALVPSGAKDALPLRSAISVPMTAGTELLGTLSVGALQPGRFGAADERLLWIIAGQIVVAVQNARLHDSISRGKRDWERTFDAISHPMAVFDGDGVLLRGNTGLAALMGRPVTELRHVTCGEVGLCGGGCPSCAVGRALRSDFVSREEITRDDQIFSVTTFPIGGDSEGAAVV